MHMHRTFCCWLFCLSMAASAQPLAQPVACPDLLVRSELEIESNADGALRGSDEAIAQAQLEGNQRCQVEALIMRARAQRYLGSLREASNTLREAALRATEQKFPDLKALAQARLGQALEADGDLDQAIAVITEAIEGSAAFPSVRAHALNLLGHVYQVAQRYAEAERSYQQSLALYRELGEIDRTASVLLNLAVTARAQSKLGESESLSRLALKQFELNNDPRGTASALHNLGSIQVERGELDLAMNSHREALVQRERLKDGLGTSISQTSLAKVLLARAALRVSGDPRQAERLRREAVGLLEQAAAYKRSEQTRPSLMATVQLLAEAHAVLDEHAAAYARMQDVVQLQREIFNDQASKRFAELSQRFALDHQADQLAHAQLAARAAESEAQSRSRLLIALTMACLLALVGLVGMALVSRARRRALLSSQALRSAERLLIAAINNAPTGIVVVARDDRILQINRAALDAFGMRRESPLQWVGRSANAIRERLAFTDLDGRPLEREQLPLSQVFREGRASEQLELVILDGREGRRALVTAAPVFDSHDQLSAAVLALVDITELRMIESQQDQLRLRLHTAERSEAIHLALGGLAHEFSNQLGVAIGYAELLPEHDDTVAELREALARSSDLVRQLQLLAGYVLARPSMIKPAELAQQVHEALLIARPDAQVELQLEEALPSLHGDVQLLRQALSELLNNALESGAEHQSVRLSLSLISDLSQIPGSVVQRPESDEHYLRIAVSDDGRGMNEQTRKRAFDPYFSGRPGGRGLGLSLVAGIARAHRGGLYLDSYPHAGTRISLVLPVNPGTGSATSVSASRRSSPTSRPH